MDFDADRAFMIVEPEATDMDVGGIFRFIFSSCDVDNIDSVQVSTLIEFIKPYVMEDLSALSDLQLALDPQSTNIHVNSERFYEVINHWSQKIGSSSSSTDSHKLPSLLNILDNKDLPYTHSTPRASLGDKLLRCKDLLNLSNVSGYSLSTSRLDNPVESDKSILEEEIKKLEHQLLKTTSELSATKLQLAASEDSNDQLQLDIERVKRRLQAEQQVNEHLQKDLNYCEALREDLGISKKYVEELRNKLSQSEKDNLYYKNLVDEMELEQTKLEKKVESLSKQHKDCLKEMFNAKTDFEAKEEQMTEILKLYNELKSKLSEQKDFIHQITEENDLLHHQKLILEKALKAKSSNSTHSNLDGENQREGSSEEDFCWKVEQGLNIKSDEDNVYGTPESLHMEMHRSTMRDLGEQTAEAMSVREKIEILQREKLNSEQKLTDVSEQLKTILAERMALHEKLTQFEQSNSVKNKELEEEILSLKGLDSARNEEITRCQEDRNKLEKDLAEFKENLEKKLVSEFEGKVKYSMDAEEKILHLTHTCNKHEEELKSLFGKLSVKSRALADTENRTTTLTKQNELLQKEIHSLNALKTELEVEIAKLKIEQDHTLAKIENIDSVTEQIQNHIENKNGVIEELKQLNRKLEVNLNKAQLDFRKKVDDILELRNDLTKGLDIKNELWKKVKTLERNLYITISEKNKSTENYQSLLDQNTDQKIEFSNLLIVYDLEVNKNGTLAKEVAKCNEQKDQLSEKNNELRMELNKAMSRLEEEVEKNQNLESKIRDLKEQFPEVNRQDSTCQTTVNSFEEIETESNQILEELEAKLNKEISKNRSLTKDLVDIKNNYSQNNDALNEMKKKLAGNEAEMAQKLQDNCAKYNHLAEELCKVKELLKQTQEAFEEEAKRNLTLSRDLHETREKHNSLIEKLKRMEIKESDLSKVERELNQSKETLEIEIAEKVLLSQELSSAKDTIIKSHNEISEISSELKQVKETLERELRNSLFLSQELEEKTGNEKHLIQLVDELEERNAEFSDKGTDMLQFGLIRQHNYQLEGEIDAANEEKDRLVEKLSEASAKVIQLEEQLSAKVMENVNLGEQVISLQTNLNELAEKMDLTKQEKEALNQELLILKQTLSDGQKVNAQCNKTSQCLQEELAKNKALFENFSLLKKERDSLSFDLKESQALLANSQILGSKKQSELLNLKTKYSLLEAKIDSQVSELETLRNNLEIVTLEKEELRSQLGRLKISPSIEKDRDANKGKTYSRQQITIDKLKVKLEDLESQLKKEQNKNRQLTNDLSGMEAKVTGNRISYKRDETAIVAGRLNSASEELEILNLQLEERKAMSTNEIGIQVDVKEKCEGKTINKFTLANHSESPERSLDIEAIGLANLMTPARCTKSSYSIHSDSVLEVPSLDVHGFADDIVDELDINDSIPGKKLEREELENKVTALTLRLVANANSISERIEKQTEKYRCQYEAILTLVGDISHRLRDHVCIGTAEPIVPVYVLLEEVKIQLKGLVQNASQVGVLICEDRMKRCWNLVINYVAMLRQENEALHNKSRETTPTQTGLTRRRNRFTQDKSDLTEGTSHRRSHFGRCSKLSALLLFVVAFAMAVSLIINVNCRMSASENQYCPLDGIAHRINIGLPPM